MTDLFERLNRETRDWNNGISRNISPTDGLRGRIKASELLAQRNNHTYKMNNGCYPDRLYK